MFTTSYVKQRDEENPYYDPYAIEDDSAEDSHRNSSRREQHSQRTGQVPNNPRNDAHSRGGASGGTRGGSNQEGIISYYADGFGGDSTQEPQVVNEWNIKLENLNHKSWVES